MNTTTHNIIETERLFIRAFTLTDASFIIDLVNSKGWLTFIGDRNIHTIEEATNYLQNGPIKSYQTHGFGLWLVQEKNLNKPIGMCGIIKRDTLENPDIGFAFLPNYEGKGYAFEAAKATLLHATKHLKLPKIFAITMPENVKSVKLLEKIGLTFTKNIKDQTTGETLQLYQL